MADLVIYGNSVSGNCWKVKWTAEQLGLPFDWREVAIFKGESRTEEFLKRNPWGQVPTAVFSDGRVLSQSNAICLHLAEGSHLLPEDPFDRAKVYEWLFWEQNSHETTIATRRANIQFRGLPAKDDDPLLSRGQDALARMEKELTDSSYFGGGALTLADIALVAYTRVAPEGGFNLGNYPQVAQWIDRVEADLNIEKGAF